MTSLAIPAGSLRGWPAAAGIGFAHARCHEPDHRGHGESLLDDVGVEARIAAGARQVVVELGRRPARELVALMTPRSRGALRATSAGPPSIDPGHLREPEDAERLTAGARLAHRLATHLGVDGPEPVLENVGSYQHPVGTCRMGPAGDPHAVVDGTGRVHGVEGLSVIDASVMPSIPSANTNLPTLMLAERLA